MLYTETVDESKLLSNDCSMAALMTTFEAQKGACLFFGKLSTKREARSGLVSLHMFAKYPPEVGLSAFTSRNPAGLWITQRLQMNVFNLD
jgi:hypothetical protein